MSPDERADEPAIATPSRWRMLARLGLGLALFAAVLAVLIDAGGRPHIRFVAWAWALGLLGSAAANAVTARRWQLLSEALTDARLGYGAYFHHLAWTRVVGQFLPSLLVDLVGRSASVRAAGGRETMARLLVPLVLERILDLLLPAVLLGWALAWHALHPSDATAWASLAAVLAVFALLAVPLLEPLARTLLRSYVWLRRLRKQDAPAIELGARLVDAPLARRVSALSLLRHGFVLLQYWGAAAGFGVVLAPLVLAAAAPLAQLAGLVGVTPGALGIQEGGWAGALGLLGTAPSEIAVVVIATRAAMIVNFAMLAFASWHWRKDRS